MVDLCLSNLLQSLLMGRAGGTAQEGRLDVLSDLEIAARAIIHQI